MGLPPFEAVVARYSATVLRVCRALLDPSAAEDAWSETFLSAMRAYPTLRADSNIEAWLVTIAHRKAIDAARARARSAVPIDEIPELASKDGRANDHAPDIWSVLMRLPIKQRRSVAYHYIAGMSYAEVAQVLGGTPEAARRAGADGIAALRRIYMNGEAR